MIKAYFSEKPDRIRYITSVNGDVDIWLRTNIEEIVDTDDDGNELISWSADENYFRAKEKNMSLKYVEDNYDTLLTYSPKQINKASIEERLSELEFAIAELIGGAFG